ncbi:MAG: hypothetical protein NC201_06955 [Prevotella sp.]|nr:hypothetical protein [Bacteroides sp.]MCM1366967.1 hypothetical protein [Prevotella sp.]MCM1436751.1 hypothetical protein [Prevotella sp.]
MIQIATFPNNEAAYIAKGMLAGHGIQSSVEQTALSSVFPAPEANVGGVIMYVDESEAEDALRLLKEHGDI